MFFGPDTYRFARWLRQATADIAPTASFTIIDIGCGSGAGGLYVADLLRERGHADLILSDINPEALRLSRINAALNGVANVRTILSDVFDRINEGGNLIISNPPYLVNRSGRMYRHGGGELGGGLSIRIVATGIERLCPDGRLLLYTGAPIVDGVDSSSKPCARFWRRAAAITATRKSIQTYSGRSSTTRPMTASTG